MKDGEVIASNETFETSQYLQDGVQAEYNNYLTVYLEPAEVVGVYTCSVDNTVSEPAVQTLTIQGQM